MSEGKNIWQSLKAFFGIGSKSLEKTDPKRQIVTDGGAFIGGDVNTDGGDFVGRDKIVNAGRSSVAIGGNANASSIVTGRGNIIRDYDINITNSNVTLAVERYLNVSGEENLSEDLRAATEWYFDYLIAKHRYLETKGFAVRDRLALRLPLLNLYVPLMARLETPSGEIWKRNAMLAGRSLEDQEGENIQLSGLQPVLDLLREHAGLIVLGDPGSGKTTFLKYLALRLAIGDTQALGLGERLPILVPVSAFADVLESQKNIRLDDFIGEYFYNLGTDLPIKEMLCQALEDGNALVLLDGLDEVGKVSLRNQVVRKIVDFYAFHKQVGNKFVLTSRIVGYREVRPAVDDLMECTLSDFDDTQIQAFLEHWSLTLEKQIQGDNEIARRNAQREKTELWIAIQQNSGVRALASNPLLLTILTLIKRQGVILPERRVELYDLALRTLLSTWNRARSLDGYKPGRDVDERQTIQLLAPLAFWMHENKSGVGLVQRRDLERRLEELFKERGEEDPYKATQQFIQDVNEYAGLLLERGPNEYGFIHLTFEEYLAAIAVAQKGQLDWKVIYQILSDSIGEAAWREIFLLTIGYISLIKGDEQVSGHIIEALLVEQPGQPGEAVVMAGEAVWDIGPRGVPHKLKQTVLDALIETMKSVEIGADLRRRSGFLLGQFGWQPNDLDAFLPIPTGKFLYGDEKEKREINYPYWIAKYPVTNLQFGRFLEAGGYYEEKYWSEQGWDWRQESGQIQPRLWDEREYANPIFPVVGVTWYEAEAYCNWLASQELSISIPEDYTVRLPSEEEWERAARGTDGREYPWGNRFDFANANVAKEIGSGIGSTAVCTYPQGVSPAGVWDLSGNVWEWNMNLRDNKKATRVLRGGSWINYDRLARCACRTGFHPVDRDDDFGFRVVVSLAFRS